MKRLFTLLLVAALLMPFTGAYAEEKAADMRLEASQGAVSVTDEKDKEVTVSDGLKLFDGYKLTTGAESFAWISLDQTKALKLDEDSSAKINKSGKKLAIDLEKGNLLVDVSSPLGSDETLDIRTSTTITGVRGTVFFVKVLNDDSAQVGVLEGSVSMTYTDPNTGNTQTVAVDAGQLGTAPPPADAGQGKAVGLLEFEADEVDSFVLDEIRTKPALAQRLSQSESAVVRSLVPVNVVPAPVYVHLVLTTGSKKEVAEFNEALEKAQYLLVDINGVESFQPGTDVELGASQSVKLEEAGLELTNGAVDDEEGRYDLTNAGVLAGDDSSSLLAGDAVNAGVITVEGTIDLEKLTNSGTVNIGSPEISSEIDAIENNSGGVINIYGELITYQYIQNSVGGVINVYGIFKTCNLLNDGVINILDGGVLQILGGAEDPSVNRGEIAIIDGTLNVDAEAALDNAGEIDNDSSINNEGAITNESGATITTDGIITNEGTITNESGATITNDGTIDNYGTIENKGVINGTGSVTESI